MPAKAPAKTAEYVDAFANDADAPMIHVRTPKELKTEFQRLCTQAGTTTSAHLRRLMAYSIGMPVPVESLALKPPRKRR